MIQVPLTPPMLLCRNKILVSQLIIICLVILSLKELHKIFQAILEKYCPGTPEFVCSLQTHRTLRRSHVGEQHKV